MPTRDVERNIDDYAALFAALADPTRLRLVAILAEQRTPHALCVNALAMLLGVTQSAVSQHLRVLKGIGLVRGERRGYHVHYYLNPIVLKRYRDFITMLSIMEEPEAKQV